MVSYRERMIRDVQLHGHGEVAPECSARATPKLVEFCAVPGSEHGGTGARTSYEVRSLHERQR